MYGIIADLCKERGITIGKMCGEIGISRGVLGDLKTGRTKKLSAEVLAKVASYLGVTSDCLIGKETKNTPTDEGERKISKEELKFALFGSTENIDDDDLDDVFELAAIIKRRKHKEK